MAKSGNYWRTWLVSLALAVVTALVYWPVRHYDFVQYDDDDYVFNNPTVVKGLKWEGLVWSVVDAHASNWHPVTWASHMFDCQFFGLDAGRHHMVNLLLHCANAVLLFLLVRTMTGAFWRSAFVAALFAWHPLRVESVAWISERKDVLSGLFFMLTLWAYVVYAKRKAGSVAAHELQASSRGASSARAAGSVVSFARRLSAAPSFLIKVSLACYLLGLLSKPMLVSVPFILLAIDFWPLNRFQFQSGVAASCRGLLREKVPYFLLALAVGLVTILAQHSGRAMIPLQSEGITARAGNFLAAYPAYLEKLVWPRDLTVLYLRPAATPVLKAVCGALILAGFSAISFWNLRRRPYLAVGWAWFVVMLLPVSGLLQVGLQSIADRYTYLPAIGLGLIAAWGAPELAAATLPGRVRQWSLAISAGAVLLICVALTREQLAFWQNTETLMGHALQIDPNNYIAHQNLGVYYSRLGQVEAARIHRQRVRELDPSLQRTLVPATNSVPHRLDGGLLPENLRRDG